MSKGGGGGPWHLWTLPLDLPLLNTVLSEYFGTNFVQIAYSKPKIQSNENIAIFNGLQCHIFNVNFRKTELDYFPITLVWNEVERHNLHQNECLDLHNVTVVIIKTHL